MCRKIVVFFIFFMVSFIITNAFDTKISVKNHKTIELFFENVLIDDLSFKGTAEIKIEFDSDDSVIAERKNNQVIIKALEEETRIQIILPKHIVYYYRIQDSDNDSYCKFTSEYFNLSDSDNQVVKYKDGVLRIKDDDEDTEITISNKKIYIKNEDGEEIEISSDGFINSNKKDEDQENGFWGKLLGNAIQSAAHLAITEIGDSPEGMAKFFINSDQDENFELNLE